MSFSILGNALVEDSICTLRWVEDAWVWRCWREVGAKARDAGTAAAAARATQLAANDSFMAGAEKIISLLKGPWPD